MKCLCCGKDIDKNGENGWHKSCIKRFFGASKLPEIEIVAKTHYCEFSYRLYSQATGAAV